MPRDGWSFRRGEAFSKQGANFTVERRFRKPFRSCEMKGGGCEMALVCQGVVSQLQNQLRNGAMDGKLEFLRLWGFRRAFRSCEMKGAVKWHSCAKGVFRSCEIFHRGWLWGCKMISQWRALFATKPWFRSGLLGVVKLFCNQWPFSQGPHLGYEISQTMNFLLLLSFFWLSETFLHFLCNSY